MVSGRDECKEAKWIRVGCERTGLGRVIPDTVVGEGKAVTSADPGASVRTPTLLGHECCDRGLVL